ncbi:MAG TPA: immunoglobulin-like domain-containing protein [Haloplasmataceae bacterium]
MKRRLALLFFFIMSLALFSCQRVDRRFEQVFQEQLISFAEGDSIDHVTQDVALKTSSDVVTGAVISWVSENEAIIQIAGTIGIVNRPAQDTEVQLTATVTIGKQSKDKSFKLMVKGLNTNHPIESEPTVSDIRFKGVKNWQLTVGDSMPNFLNGVIATDGEGNLLPVSILYNTVDPSAVGDYVVIYEAKDGERRATKTMTVSVIPKAPTTQWLTKPLTVSPSQVRVIKILIFLASMGFDGRLWNPERINRLTDCR